MALIKKAGTLRSDATRGLPDPTRGPEADRTPDDSTRSINPAPTAPDDSTRGIGPSASGAAGNDATRGIGNVLKGVSRIGTEDIRSRAPLADATRMPGTAGMKKNQEQMSASPTLLNGTVLEGRYQIEGVLGVGGMSVVYRGRDLRFKDVARFCAVKEMFQSSPDSQTRMLSLKNFERESGLLATLNHPNIPKVYDFFEEGGRAYVVMELINGSDLETVLEQTTVPLDEQQVGRWAMQICDVLMYLHNHTPEPIIFRDMKPSNMIVTPDDRIVLIDFGIARIFTRNDKKGTMIGTEGYSPPEQYRGIAEARGDIYALGATMHHLLTNSDPRLETPFTFNDRPIRQLNPGVSPELEAVVMKALEYDMANRWASAEEFRQALLGVPGLAPQGSLAGAMPAAATPGLPLRKGATTTDLVWKFQCEDEVRSSPTVRNGMLYVGCYDTNLYALDAKRGDFRWKKATEGGISSSPAVWNDIVVVGSEDNNVYAFDTRTGVQRWVFRTEKPVRSSPRVEDRLIYVGSDDQHFYAIDGINGRQIWRHRGWQWFRSSACIANEVVVIGAGDGNVYCLDAYKGGLRWKQKLSGGVMSSAAATDKLVIIGCMDNNLYGLDIEGGWPVWKFRTGHYVNSSPLIMGNRVFVGSIDGNVYAVDIKNGKQVWQYNAGAQIVSSPAADSGKIYIGGADGVIHCLDAGAGTALWTYACTGPVVSSPSVVDGVVYVGSLDHYVYALQS